MTYMQSDRTCSRVLSAQSLFSVKAILLWYDPTQYPHFGSGSGKVVLVQRAKKKKIQNERAS
jgi:hypothetical protein